MEDFIKAFRALAEPTRQRIVKLLASESMYVCQLEEILQIGQSNISQHLRILKEARLVSEEKQGWWTLYRLDREYLDGLLREWQRFLDLPLKDTPGWRDVAERVESWNSNPPVLSCRPRGRGRSGQKPGEPASSRGR
ncbi:MAG: ArsR/SmtB family transcription factor [Symbiobacteriia bacterium]